MATDFRDLFRWVDKELALNRTEKEYHKHGFNQFLEPLKARIMAADELIDEIVYRLYGLKEEEVKIMKANDRNG